MSADGDTVRDALTFYASVDPVWCPPEQAQGALAALARLEADVAERITRESGKALVEDAQRWQNAYNRVCNEKDAAEAQRDALAEALRVIALSPKQRTDLGPVSEIARAALAEAGLE